MSHDSTRRLVEQIRDLLGPAVLVHVPRRTKGPRLTGWQKLVVSDMTQEYLDGLDHRDNIGVSLGTVSDGLCTIDIDDDSNVEPFLALNPKLAGTLRTKGRRGCNLWVRIRGEHPGLCAIHHRTELDEKGKPLQVGEWRATGGQTIIWGWHPGGMKYQRLVKAPPVSLAFEEINWPAQWKLPWVITPEDELIREHGEPYSISKQGTVSINPVFFAAKFARERLTLWEPGERSFYQYEGDTGLWRPTTADQIKLQMAADLKQFADTVELPQLVNRRTNAMLSDLVELTKGQVERTGVFNQLRKLIHVKNGVLDLAADPPVLLPFSPDFYSRNACPFEFHADADCPRFKNELLANALDQQDIDLLQRWSGSVLVGHNAAQKILLLTGTAGGGKSTFADILERVIGKVNCVELRTGLLFERFEMARFVGKTLLAGKDVPGDFLSQKSASALKKLVGHDLLTVEIKGSSGGVSVRGDYNVVCTCNSRLRVHLDADVDAWRRRLLLVEYTRPRPEKPIPDFADKLVAEEGSGILRWMMEGAILHLAELETHGDFALTEQQSQRVENLLNESDSVRHFVEGRVAGDEEANVTTDELVSAYFAFCEEKAWRSISSREVRNQLPDLMLQVHRVSLRHDIDRGEESNLRGYKRVRICPCNSPF